MEELPLTPVQFYSRLEKLQSQGVEPLVDSFLFEGRPYAMHDWAEYCYFKKEFSDGLGVNPKSVALVGSGRFGYSLSPKRDPRTRAYKLWRPFGERSDFDVVVVDHRLFDAVWREMLEFDQPGSPSDPNQLTQRWWNTYDGFVDFLILPEGIPLVAQWNEVLGQISSLPWNGTKRTTKAFLFRDWFHAQRYYAKSFLQIYKGVSGGRLPHPPEDEANE